ncbi:MAG: isoprenyl transferase [Alphaproteobacteria bacterium PRO2]|nr:isoprenyl transferase [Alphaproteobacteria bacterium PRO2]
MPATDTAQTPKHIAIIMDGNGRWANRRGLPRTAGHKQGAEAARRVVKNAAEMGVEFVTLFGFSSENWSRPESEIKELMSLLRYYLRSETAELHKSGARLKVIGNRAELDEDIIQLIENAEDLTKDNDKITLVIALNYGGRHDILQAAQRLAEKAVAAGRVPDMSGVEKAFPELLMTAGIPEPDLLIRTSGEQRISNFLLWQCAYSEMVFTDTLWPDFDREDLERALQDFARRERRYGALKQTGA